MQAFDDCLSVLDVSKLLEALEGLLDRKAIARVLQKREHNLLQGFKHEVDEVYPHDGLKVPVGIEQTRWELNLCLWRSSFQASMYICMLAHIPDIILLVWAITVGYASLLLQSLVSVCTGSCMSEELV